MILAQEFYLDDFYWNVKVFYVIDSGASDVILGELEEIGCSGEDLEAADYILHSENSGLTYSNVKDGMSIIVIGKTTCPAEFQNTYDHEKLHLAMHIAKEFHINPFSEDLAYLVGKIGYETFPVAKKFMCEHCRKEL